MTNAPRRAAGFALAFVALAFALIGQGEVQRSRDRSLRNLASLLAEQKRLSARDWLLNLLQAIGGQAEAASTLLPLKQIANLQGGDLVVTLRDGFHTEPWWESYRRDFSVQGLSLEGDQLDVMNAVEGLDVGKLEVGPLVREARRNRKASLFMRAGPEGWPYAAAAAVVDVPRQALPVLVLAKAFDLGIAREMAEKLGSTIVLSDGAHVLLKAGANAQCADKLPGNESKALFFSSELLCVAAPTEMIPGLTLWTTEPLAEPARELDGDAAATLFDIRIAALLVGLIGIALALWPAAKREGAPVSKALDRSVATTPAGQPGPTLLTKISNPGLPPSGTFDSKLASTPLPASTANQRVASAPSGTWDPNLLPNPAGNLARDPIRADSIPPLIPLGNSNPRVRPAAGASDPRMRTNHVTTAISAESKTAVREPSLDDDLLALQQLTPLSSTIFGRYVLLDLLGEGGMAEVYTAVTYGAERFRRSFVVKRLRPEMLHNPTVVTSFIDEANLASSLVHSNILPVFDFGKVGDEYYMATEYILGRDLGKLSRRSIERDNARLPLAQVLFAAHQTLEALDYAHHKKGDDGNPLGIVHRDVSPNNIMVSARGEVKLFDFGIAKAEGRLTQTSLGMVKGNVRFMSPEQARGEPVDSRSDLFAVGLCIYYVLTGEALYEADTAYLLLVKAATGPGPVERELMAKLPREVQRILDRALQPNAADRFQTAAEFATALQPYIAGQQAALGRSMEKLYGAELREEEQRFNESAAAALAKEPTAPGTRRDEIT